MSLTEPAAGAVFTAPASVAIAANASDTDGTVTTVEFYAGSTLIGTDTTAPYSMTWNNVAAGLYTLTAVARDNAGAMTVSGARDIRVDAPSLPRTAIFTASSNHATAVDRYFLEIFPAGANPLVANPVATRDLGKPPVVSGECTVDVSATTVALPPGSYIATVTAIGSAGRPAAQPRRRSSARERAQRCRVESERAPASCEAGALVVSSSEYESGHEAELVIVPVRALARVRFSADADLIGACRQSRRDPGLDEGRADVR